MSAAGRKVVLDVSNPDDVCMFARVRWEHDSVTEKPFDDLGPWLRKSLVRAAGEFLSDLAGQRDVTLLPADSEVA